MTSDQSSDFHLALVTGSSSGIGEALCRLLAHKGINLIIHGRDAVRLQKVAEELGKKVKVDIINADLGNEGGRAKVVEYIHHAKPDLIVNNAGFGLYGDALTYDTAQQMEILNVNANAVLELSLEAARTLLSEKKKGVILNVSSAAAFPIFPCMSVYSAAKAFVNQFSESFDEEMRGHGIRILSACPGMVDTGFRGRAGGSEYAHSSYHMTPDFAAKEIWRQIEVKNKIHIFNWIYRWDTFLVRYVIPKKWVSWVIRHNITQRHPPRDFK